MKIYPNDSSMSSIKSRRLHYVAWLCSDGHKLKFAIWRVLKMMIKNYTTPSIAPFSRVPLSVFNPKCFGFCRLSCQMSPVCLQKPQSFVTFSKLDFFRFFHFVLFWFFAFFNSNPESRNSGEEIIAQVVNFWFENVAKVIIQLMQR